MQNNINIQVYSSCNCNCNFCTFTDKKFSKIDPTFVLNYLNKNKSINYIVLTGGEPTFAIDECIEIIKNINKDKNKIVLQTNGWWGNNDKIKEMLKNNPPSVVHLSVDSEKQKKIALDTVLSAYDFLNSNSIKTYVVNHTEDEDEYANYKTVFPELKRGKVIHNNGVDLHDCGLALLANNTIGVLNINGWGCQNG